MSSDKPVMAEPCVGAFSGCLVEGNAKEKAREKKIKRRAIAVSVALQSLGLAALVIVPLFAKPAELTERIATPIPPYRHRAAPRTAQTTDIRDPRPVCTVCFHLNVTPITPGSSGPTTTNSDTDLLPPDSTLPTDSSSFINALDRRLQPTPPDDPPRQKRRVRLTQIDPALLIRRVEPVYPAIPRQLRKGGKVELHAVIATDGSIQFLEVVSGDPLFINSAREAVLQWRYKPTYLNGQPVEIDTFITVIYTLP